MLFSCPSEGVLLVAAVVVSVPVLVLGLALGLVVPISASGVGFDGQLLLLIELLMLRMLMLLLLPAALPLWLTACVEDCMLYDGAETVGWGPWPASIAKPADVIILVGTVRKLVSGPGKSPR